jgi:hypothetical protein
LWEDNERAGHERDFPLFAAGLTFDEVNPLFFSTMKSMKDMKGKMLSKIFCNYSGRLT